MAPDLNTLQSFQTDGYASNEVPRKSYTIPDIVMHAPTVRKIRVLSIGAGVTGIINAYRIQKELENVEHVIYEKNADIGGTWLENRYPGCACDIPSHAYTLPFALNPDWPRFFSYSPDIWVYLNKVCEVWGLRKYMNFNSEIIGCYWEQDKGQWRVKIKQVAKDGNTKLFEEHCHVLLNGTGILNNYKWPDINGIEKFKGKIMHTARWPKDYQAEQWKKDRVAVIGSGASSIQTVPTMQPHAKHLDVFVRTGVWFVQIANNYGANHVYTDEEKAKFHTSPYALTEHAKSIEDQVNGLWGTFYKNSEAQAQGQALFRARMAEFIKDERLLKGFTPTFGVGCRRVTPGDPYMNAIQQDNVKVHFTAVKSITEKGVVGEDDIEREVDTIVCATGFDVSYRPRFPLVGQRGIDLADKWKVCPEGYMGLMVPDFPNHVIWAGPTFPVENGSVMGPFWGVSGYALQLIRKIQSEYIASVAPRQDVTNDFNDHAQEWIRHTIWTDDCRSWYKNNETGRGEFNLDHIIESQPPYWDSSMPQLSNVGIDVLLLTRIVNAVWPGSSLHYMEAIATPRYEDMEIEYLDVAKENRWAYLGMGYTRSLVEKGDPSPYLSVDMIDPEWMKANNIDRKEIVQAKIKELQAQLQKIEEEEKELGNEGTELPRL